MWYFADMLNISILNYKFGDLFIGKSNNYVLFCIV